MVTYKTRLLLDNAHIFKELATFNIVTYNMVKKYLCTKLSLRWSFGK